MAELKFENCIKGTTTTNFILIYILLGIIIFAVITAFQYGLIAGLGSIIIAGIITYLMLKRKSTCTVIINEKGVQIISDKDSNEKEKSNNFKKGEFMIDISGTNINPPTFGEDDYSEPTILYEVVLRIGWGSISLKRFNTYKGKDLNEMNNRNLEKAQELRTQILDLLN